MTLSPIPALDAIPDDVRKLAHGYAAVYDHSRHSPKLLAAAFEDAIMADRANHTARADVAEGYVLRLETIIRESCKQLNSIIDDGIPTDWRAWLADLEAALAASPPQGDSSGRR